MTTPHDSWGHVYDAIYEGSFGRFYTRFTDETLACIGELVTPPAHIVDFGAGTGRLSVPLAKQGYHVTAVEPSAVMLRQLRAKADEAGVAIETHHQCMQDRLETAGADLALCVFTVTLYLLDTDSLDAACRVAAAVLRPCGRLLIDIPREAMFQGNTFIVPGGSRHVDVTPSREAPGLYTYVERTTIAIGGRTEHVQDQFTIRYWPPETVLAALQRAGFQVVDDLSERFGSTGSQHLLCDKIADCRANAVTVEAGGVSSAAGR